MATSMNPGLAALSEKEKQTLRLIVRGHDAKSIARCLDLSVHTVNERLRDARRKVAVSSSREAARLLFETETDDPGPQSFGDTRIGDATAPAAADGEAAPIDGARRNTRRSWITIGVLLMTLALALAAVAALTQTPSAPAQPPAGTEAPDAAVVASARHFLELVDQSRWDDSYRATGSAFQRLNTSAVWARASEKVRTPLGAMVSRTFVSQQNLPAPPDGYEVVKFSTRFANRANATETVTLEREDGDWHVVGITVG